MTEKQRDFINTVGVLAQNEHMTREAWVLPSVCIAQAINESGWNLKAKTLFGIKAKKGEASNSLKTSEFYNGQYVQIVDAFKAFPSVAAAVAGYYDLITKSKRYKKAVNNPDYRDTITQIWKAGYATSPTYVAKIVTLIDTYGLTKWDISREQKSISLPESDGSYLVKVRANDLNIRTGPGVEYDKTGKYTGAGVFTIVQEMNGWGKLKSGAGWICLKYTERV